MTSRKFLLIALAGLAFLAAAATTSWLAWRMVAHTGALAVQQMDAGEREALQRLAGLRRDMTSADVYRVLGEPTEDLVLLAKWNGYGGSPLSQARVYFLDDHPVRVRWLKLGCFVYEQDL